MNWPAVTLYLLGILTVVGDEGFDKHPLSMRWTAALLWPVLGMALLFGYVAMFAVALRRGWQEWRAIRAESGPKC